MASAKLWVQITFRKISIAEACELLESQPEIKWKEVDVSTELDDQQLSIEVYFRDFNDEAFCFSDQAFDVGAWRRFGRAVRNSTLDWFELISDEINVGTAAQCINAFFAELKHNKSIVAAQIKLTGLLSMDVLSYFIQNNSALKTLWLASEESVTLEQSDVVSRAIRISSAKLEKVFIRYCSFENNGAFERLLEGCPRVKSLVVTCKHHWQCTAVAALLRDPSNVLRKLSVSLQNMQLDGKRAVRDITRSLVGNNHLQDLNIIWMYASYCTDIDKLLCDPSSIQSITNSNHTLKCIQIDRLALSTLADQCLELNMNENKAKVVRDKIFQFYFAGEFDVSPFSNMAVSVLPEVMSQIKGDNKQSGIYRLLMCVQELCNISDRVCSEQHGNKRMKTSG